MTQVSFGPNGEWYVHGEKRDGSGGYAWWGGTSATDSIKEWSGSSHRLQVAFGHDNRWALIQGGNGSWFSHSINTHLEERVKRVRDRRKTVHFVRLFDDNCYFISDSLDGLQWVLSHKHLEEELKKSGGGSVRDVALAGDRQWIVIRDERFVASTGVSKELTNRLAVFYKDHRARQAQRRMEISAYDARVTREREEREERERRERERREREEMERQERERQERERQRAVQESLKRRSERDVIEIIGAKRLRHGVQVTAVGSSLDLGDSFVVRSGGNGVSIQSADGSLLQYQEPKDLLKIVPYEEHVEMSAIGELQLVYMASDEYEAAISVYHVVCARDRCVCYRTAFASVPVGRLNAQTRYPAGSRVYIQDYSHAEVEEHVQSGWYAGKVRIRYDDGSIYHAAPSALRPPQVVDGAQSVVSARPLDLVTEQRRFDEYRVAEKLDRRRLKEVVEDLRTDSDWRREYLAKLESKLARTSNPQLVEQVRKLKRCKVLHLTAEALLEKTKDLVESGEGHVVHEVTYEHKDPSYRGRLFAIGTEISESDDKYPRTDTLQAMHRDLRHPLVGSFGHDVDCENSEYRLLCSLASQLGLEHLVPTVFDYRNRRKVYLEMICQRHGVSTDAAKRLPNIILSSGIYKTWLRRFNLTSSDSVRKVLCENVVAIDVAASLILRAIPLIWQFANALAMEIRVLRHELLKHPRFGWTAIDRAALVSKGKAEGTIDALLLPRIVQSCENEVLGIVHRSLHDNGWVARAKIFDGLIVEPIAVWMTLKEALADAQSACEQRGWSIVLSEKPLHGLQDQPLATVKDAREVVSALDASRAW